MLLIEAAAQKDQLRDTSAALAVELRELRVRADAAEANARRFERELELALERLAKRDAATENLIDSLVRAQRETSAAYEGNTERDMQISQLQLQIMELRMALARLRGFEPKREGAPEPR